MKTLNKIIIIALIMLITRSIFAQMDSAVTYTGFECDLTAYKTARKLIRSTDKIITYKDTLDFTEISAITLLRDTMKFHDYGKEIKLDLSEINKITFQTGKKTWLGVLIGASAGCIAGAFLDTRIESDQEWLAGSKGIIGAVIGILAGAIIGYVLTPSASDDYYIKSKINEDRKKELERIFKDAKLKYASDL